MKKILLLFLLLAITSIPNQTASAQTPDPNQDAKTQVVIIGTIHSAHYKNPNYSPERLKEIILSLRPDAILNELPLSQVDPNGRPLFRDRQKHPEGWAADTVAQQLGIRQIPFDRPDRQENFRKTKYFEKQRQSEALRKKCGECLLQNEPNSINVKIAQLQQFACQAEASLMLNAEPEVINSEANDSIKRIKKSLWYEIVHELVEKYPKCDGLIEYDHFFRDQWNIINKIMADNIIKAAKEYPGKRLVVVTGATHRYILRDLLKDNPNIELKEYWEVKNMCNSELNAGLAYYSSQAEISKSSKQVDTCEGLSRDVSIATLMKQSDIVLIGRNVKEVICNPSRSVKAPKILCAYSIKPIEFVKGGPTDSDPNGNPIIFVDMESISMNKDLLNLAKPKVNDPNAKYIFFLRTGSTTGYGSYRLRPLSPKQWFLSATVETIQNTKASILLPDEWGQEAWGLTMAIHTAKQKYSVAPLEPIVIELFVKNVSKQTITIPQHRSKWNYYPYTYFHLDGNRTANLEKPPGRMGAQKLPDIELEPEQIYIEKVRLDSWGWQSANGLSPFRPKTKWKLRAQFRFNKDKNMGIDSQEITIEFD